MTNTSQLLEFIMKNELQDVPFYTGGCDELMWSVFLNEEHSHEIEYTFNLEEDGKDTIKYIVWTNDDDDIDCEETILTTEEALHYRRIQNGAR